MSQVGNQFYNFDRIHLKGTNENNINNNTNKVDLKGKINMKGAATGGKFPIKVPKNSKQIQYNDKLHKYIYSDKSQSGNENFRNDLNDHNNYAKPTPENSLITKTNTNNDPNTNDDSILRGSLASNKFYVIRNKEGNVNKTMPINRTNNFMKSYFDLSKKSYTPHKQSTISYATNSRSKFLYGNELVGKEKETFTSTVKTRDIINFVGSEKYEELKEKTERAKREGKTFSISSNANGASIVRAALLRRGWMERYALADDRGTIHEHFIQAPDREAFIVTKMLKNIPVKFIWTDSSVNWPLVPSGVLINRIPLSGKSLSTKTGLLRYLQSQVWTFEDGIADVSYPRTFSVQDEADLKHFAANYRITACANMLKKFYTALLDTQEEVIIENPTNPAVSIKYIDFSIQRLCEYLGSFEHAYLDQWNFSVVTQVEWEDFLNNYYEFVFENKLLENSEKYDVKKLLTSSIACLDKLRSYWPELDFEGVENVWLVKPAAQSCGRGIVILKKLSEITQNCSRRYPTIVQKYIEKPMLIYNTKFDIRQWFLVTRVCPLQIWMYRKCYLRFCSKEFSLNNLHVSVHLSNNSIQWRYENLKKPNTKLPKQNMWDSDKFLDYLRHQGIQDKWYDVVVPGIRRAIIGALLASQESMTDRVNSFNLYGADFLLTEDMKPLLIEINSTPCLRSTTDVTARLCPLVLDDVVQVVTSIIGKNKDGGYTGNFDIIFDQVMSPELPLPAANTDNHSDLMVVATPAQVHIFKSEIDLKKSALLDFSQKHSHWDDRSIKYDNLSWYKNRENIVELVAVIDANKVRYEMPKIPGDVTPMNEVSYVTRNQVQPNVSNWMTACYAWVSQKLEKKKSIVDNRDNEKNNQLKNK